MKLRNPFRRKTDGELIERELAGAEVIPAPPVSRGGVRKMQHKQFSLDEPRTGGRVVKTMPRNLRQMRELSERTDD